MAFPMQYSLGTNHHQQQNLDPQLHMPQMQPGPVLQHGGMQAHLPQRGMRGVSSAAGDAGMGLGMQMPQDQAAWASQLSPEDTWSNSSRGQQMPVAPATLNVEDW